MTSSSTPSPYRLGLALDLAPPPYASMRHMRSAFDAMADEYDDLRSPYYRHSLGLIDSVLARELRPSAAGQRALDVCCGTGIQSLRLARLGYRVTGIDLAPRLLAIARHKLGAAGHADAHFVEGDATRLPAPDAAFDLVNCCGALSMIWSWREALAEIGRCLRPGGRLLVEVDGKWNLDMLWEVVNGLTGNALGYDETLGQALRHLLPPWRTGHRLEYSFKLESGGAVPLDVKLFTASELRRELEAVGLRPRRRWAMNSITNVIPSTVLHRPEGDRWRRRLFDALAAVERRVAGRWPANTLGCSLLVLAVKEGRD
jgi:SAM-dependent methyltransferase